MTGTDRAVVVENLTKSFGDFTALRGIDLEVGRGEILGLLGPNGAGKTTTVDILATLSRPTTGRVVVAGHDVAKDPAAVRRAIMLTGQNAAVDELLTGRENLILFGRLQGLRKAAARSRAAELLERFELDYAADRRVGTYSGGMRRRIDIACGLVVRPEVVFLDEPTTGLDPRSRQGVWELVAQLRDEGIATLLTTQYLEEADALSDRIAVIDRGTVIAEGTADQLKERTGATVCEIVPRHRGDLQRIAASLGPLAGRGRHRADTERSDRISIPAPDGTRTLMEAVARIDAAGIELLDVALRRPSLDEVFFALTGDAPVLQREEVTL
ncbi:ATP-binding cassette domain-containing protein [Tsukamurella asaccharolytica]|uniref:ATP-binding cassette domain-containing protein n=1 Tax=Tsukamurella asaccharolytica TaxID=2592067 RepID=A0A5C5RCK7_9ACTN|nr:ATP-binding cassette domain-containing protein [Tsukamurella asaccharolytica]TWS19915.1 ATP-binding cassette domain-containing protein [Tsukamurella asaccharolytica]